MWMDHNYAYKFHMKNSSYVYNHKHANSKLELRSTDSYSTVPLQHITALEGQYVPVVSLNLKARTPKFLDRQLY
jgi:hypothetical protein